MNNEKVFSGQAKVSASAATCCAGATCADEGELHEARVRQTEIESRTREEILNDPTLTSYHRGRIFERMSAEESLRPPSPPDFAPEISDELRGLAQAISQAQDQIAKFDSQAEDHCRLLEQQRQKVSQLS